MKKRTFLASIVTIALCLSLIAGSTFALFTSETDVDIAVDAGRVNIQAGLTAPILYSVEPDANGTEIDEYGKPYSYVQQPATPGQADNTFANGGTAVLGDRTNDDGSVTENGIIELVNVTPGDKIVFNLTGKNTSDVAVQYRYKIECIEGYDLMSGFVATVAGTKYASMAAYTSAWEPLAVGADIPEAQLALELPVSAGNEFQMLDAKIKVSVEAVQNNADVSDTDAVEVKYITTVKDEAELLSKIYADEILHIFVREDMDTTVVIDKNLKDKTIDANGNDVHLQFGLGDINPDPYIKDYNYVTLDNVVVTNLKTSTIDIKSGVSGDLSILNSEFVSEGANSPKRLISGAGIAADELSVTIDGCVLDANGAAESAVYFFNIMNCTIRNTVFKNTKSWAIMQANGSITGNVVVSDCVFEGCKGILKGAINGGAGSGSLSGNFTFANNKMNNCIEKDHTANGIPVYMNISPINGTITFSNNTMNGVVVTVEDMGMLG